jgi:undecaprenyl phosphate N,N'-diacetylbacillosamine 1-phosphate transferase
MIYRDIIKPFFDHSVSLVMLILLSPILAIVAIMVRMDSPGPVIFMQDRLGMNYRVFRLYKFRTMTHKKNRENRQVFTNDPEITGIGRFLRRSKLDELPQLVNILKGDMSFVGPRPSLPDLKEKFNEDGKVRVKVKPGLTNLAAVNGSIFLTWPERWVFDRMYVERQSFLMDMSIMLRTAVVVIMGENFYHKKGMNEIQAGDGK